MSSSSTSLSEPPVQLDYSLTGINAGRAIEKGLAEADWYTSPVPRETMRWLLERKDGPALRDTAIWFGLLLVSGCAGYALWGTWWAVVPFVIYGVLYGSTSDSRWHESSHGTAFRTDWMNNALYEVASFMVMRESTVWRWSHTRHHSDTIIVGRDPEIAVPRPPHLGVLAMSFFSLQVIPGYFRHLVLHSLGRITAEERTFIPESEFPKIFFRARIYVLVYAGAIVLTLAGGGILPLMFIGLPNIYGAWLMPIFGYTQHAGLAENVLDHRLNCRTVYMNRINRFLYWNMNYHVEHHMFPLVPYHALPRLHEAVKADLPTPYRGLGEAWREIVPAILRQIKDPAYHIKRKLPAPAPAQPDSSTSRSWEGKPDALGWIEVCRAEDLNLEDVLRFDLGKKTYAVYRSDDDRYFATDGFCTHGHAHLAEGLVKGKTIECPKHNGRFNLLDGSPARPPVCRALSTYPLENREGRIYLNVQKAGGRGADGQKTYYFQVVSNRNVATFIKELVLKPLNASQKICFTPGDYLQFDIPAYGLIRFREFDIPEPYARVWESQHLFDLVAHHAEEGRRNNYSLASNQETENIVRFNVRIATPPPGQDCLPGAGSSYLFHLKTGDTITAIGPFGDFQIKPTQKEMVYIGGGAGMAPLRAHLTHLFETEKTARKVSFWYGARSRQELFYEDYFTELARYHPNFHFHVALSSPLPEDEWPGLTGFIHEVVRKQYLAAHSNPQAVEYYLCGPPMMIKACTQMLTDFGVGPSQLAFDEF